MLTLVLVVAVIFLFLRNVSATLIPSLALPISVIGTFAVMYMLDYSLDNLSLMALTLAVGFVVDDAIVMLENIVRHMEMGKPPMKAALDGAAEVGFTIISMTISLTAVFIPILFLGGIVGRLFHEFAVTIAVSILVSGFVSLTLTPMLSSRFLRPHAHDEKHSRAYQITEAGYEWLLARYERRLDWVMNHRAVDDGLLGRDSRRHGRAVRAHPKGFIPSQDSGQLFVTTETAQGTSFDDMVTHQQQVADDHQGRHEHSGLLFGGRRQPDGVRARTRAVCSSASSRATSGSASTTSSRSCGQSSRRCPASSCTCRTRRRSRSAGACRRACISSRCRARTSRRSIRRPSSSSTQARKSTLLQDVTSDLQLGNPQASVRDRPRARGVARRHGRRRSRRRCTTRTARGRSRRSTRRTTSTGW